MAAKVKAFPAIQPARTLRLAILSDTHQWHREIGVPDAEILIHAGDFTMFSSSQASIVDFNNWLGELPHRHKIVVPGNHEFFLAKDISKRSMLSNAVVLINESVEIDGLRIWGSPVTPLSGGAFGLSSADDRRRLYAGISKGTDVMVTHGPPYSILDSAPGSTHHSGCLELLDAVLRVRPRLHVFGHIHGAHGIVHIGQTTFVNGAMIGADGDLETSPIVLQMSGR
jgi:Icc-related predicted phosphoesterase